MTLSRAGVNTLSEQQRSIKRAYRKTTRAEQEQETAARIVDAAEELHGSIGPARTTVSAIAERAGVTRATVYRHFPDDEALFLACSSQWLSRQRLPDPAVWQDRTDPVERLRVGLADVYRYYRSGEQMLTLVHRDQEVVPPRVAARRVESAAGWVAALSKPFATRRRTVRAALGHAVAFSTWRSLCVENGLSDRAAVDLMVALVAAAAADR